MGLMTERPVLRWAVPGAVVAIVLGAAGLTAVTANATPTLPPRTAAELLVDVQNADPAALSGTIVQNADLGLPELPALGGGGSSSFSSLVSGTHTLRVWIAGPEQQRLALLGTLGESDLIRNGTDVWTWSSDTNSATHYQLPPTEKDGEADVTTVPDSSSAALTPQQVADLALSAIDPTTIVTTDGTAEVAGRPAHELVLAPRDTASLIGSIRIAIDAEQHIPLRVQVLAKGAVAPAFEVGFTAISFDVPGPEQFQFTPPPGATVTETDLGQDAVRVDPESTTPDPGTPGPAAGFAEPTVLGTGWTSVVVTSLPTTSGPDQPEAAPADGTQPEAAPSDGAQPEAAPAEGAPFEAGPAEGGPTEVGPSEEGRSGAADLGAVLGSLPEVSGDWGSGRLLQSALFSVLVTDDGRILAGAVAPELLYQAAAQ